MSPASPPSSRAGFALVLTLAMLALAGLALATLARRSLFGALQAETQARELQRRWAEKSLRATVLERARPLLREAAPGPAARPRRVMRCRLAGRAYVLRITDEQAKLNINAALRRRGRGAARGRLEALLAETEAQARPALRSWRLTGEKQQGALPATGEGDRPWLRLGSYGQLFRDASPARLLGRRGNWGAARWVTCWGDGRVNLRSAPDRVLAHALEGALSGPLLQKLLEARRAGGGRAPDVLIARLAKDLDKQERRRLRTRITGRSSAHGLWISTKIGERWRHSFAVRSPRRRRVLRW